MVIFSPAAGGHPYAELRDFAREAERVGVESFWVSDHLFGGPVKNTLEICRRLWTGERATYAGKHYQIVDAETRSATGRSRSRTGWLRS